MKRNKKILIISISAALIIILTTFTSVVGVQSRESTIKKCSPLFDLRVKNAIDEEDKNVAEADYVGEGKDFVNIPFYKHFFKNKDYKQNNMWEDTSGGATCGFLCALTNILLILVTIGLVIQTLLRRCPENTEFQNQQIYQKMQNNPLFEELVTEHPELLLEIAELNMEVN
jgi:hypothetical protein